MNGLIIPGYLVLALMGEPLEPETTAPPEPQTAQTLEELRAMLVVAIEKRQASAEAQEIEYSLPKPWIGGRFGVDHIPAKSG